MLVICHCQFNGSIGHALL